MKCCDGWWVIQGLSADEVGEVLGLLVGLEVLHELVVLLAELEEVLLVVGLPGPLGLSVELLADLLAVVALLDELVELFGVLLAVLVVLVGVVGLEADGEELEGALLGAERGVLGAAVAQLRQALHHDVAEVVLEEGRAVVALGDLLEVALLLELHWQLVGQLHHLVQRGILLEQPLRLGGGRQEVLVLVGEAEEGVAAGEVLLGEFDHAVALVFEFAVEGGDVLEVDLLGRREGVAPVDEGVGVVEEVPELLLALEGVELAVEEGDVLVVLDADLDVLAADLVADGAEVEVVGEVVEDAVGAEADVGGVGGGVRDQVADEGAARLDLALDLGLGLLEHAPLGEGGVDELDVVVLAGEVDLDLDEGAARALEAAVDHLEVVVVPGGARPGDHLALHLQLAHAQRQHHRGHDAALVQDLALLLVERQPVQDPPAPAVRQCRPLLDQRHRRLLRQHLPRPHLPQDRAHVVVLVLPRELLHDVFEGDDLEAVLVGEVEGEGGLAGLGFADDEDDGEEADVGRDGVVLEEGARVAHGVVAFLLVAQVVEAVAVEQRVGLRVVHQRVGVQLPEAAVSGDEVVEEVGDAVALEREHAAALPAVDAVLDEGLHQVVDAVGHVLDLALALHAHHLHAPGLEGLSQLFELGGVSLALRLQRLRFLRDQLLELGDVGVLLFGRLVVLLPRLLRLPPRLLALLLLLLPLPLLELLQLPLDGGLVEHAVQPLALLAGEHEHHLRELPGLAEELHDAGGDLVLLHVEEVAVDEDLGDAVEDVLDNLDFVGAAVEVGGLFGDFWVLELLALLVELWLLEALAVVALGLALALLVLELLEEGVLEGEDGDAVLVVELQQLRLETHPAQPHEQDARRHCGGSGGQELGGLQLELVQLLLPHHLEPPPLDARLELLLPLDQPPVPQRHWAVVPAEAHGDGVALLRLVGAHAVEPILVDLQVEGIDDLPDLVEDLLGGLVDEYFLADLLPEGLLDGGDGGGEEGDLLELGVGEALLEGLVGGVLGVVGEHEEAVDGDVELLEGVELLLVAGVPHHHVPPDLVQLPQVVDLGDEVLERQVLGRRGLGALLLGVLVLLLGLLGGGLALLGLGRLCAAALLRLLDAPAGRLLLQGDSQLVEDDGEHVLGAEDGALREVAELGLGEVDGGGALVEVGGDVGVELALALQHLLQYVLDVDDLEAVGGAEEVGDGLLAGLARAGDEDVGVGGEFGEGGQVLAGQVEEGVEVGLVLEHEHAARVVGGELRLALQEAVAGELHAVDQSPRAPLAEHLLLLEPDAQQFLVGALDLLGEGDAVEGVVEEGEALLDVLEAVLDPEEAVRVDVLREVLDQREAGVAPLHLQQVGLHQRLRLVGLVHLHLLLALLGRRLGLAQEVPVVGGGEGLVLGLLHEGGGEVLPLVLGLVGLDDVREGAAVDLGEVDAVGDECVDPVLVVVEGEVEDEAPGVRQLLLQLVVDQVQHVLLLDPHALRQLRQDELLDRQQSVLHVPVLVCLGRVLLEELAALQQFVDHALQADVDEGVFLGDGLGEGGLAGLGPAEDEQLEGGECGEGDGVVEEGGGGVAGQSGEGGEVLLDDGVEVLVLLLDLAQAGLELAGDCLEARVVLELEHVPAEVEAERGGVGVEVLLVLLDGVLAGDAEEVLLAADDEFFAGEGELVDVELVAVVELGHDVEELLGVGGVVLEVLQVVPVREGLVEARHGERLGHRRPHLARQVVVRQHAHRQEHLLVHREVADQVVGRLVRRRPVVDLPHRQPLALPQPVGAAHLEVPVREVVQEVLADVAPGDHLLRPRLQLPHHHLARQHLPHLLLHHPHLLLEVHVPRLLPVVALGQPALRQDGLAVQDLYLDVDVEFAAGGGVGGGEDEGVGDAGLEEFEEGDGGADVDALDGVGAHLEQVLAEVVVGDEGVVRADALEQLARQLPQVLGGELRQQEREEQRAQPQHALGGGAAPQDVVVVVDLGLEGGVLRDQVQQLRLLAARPARLHRIEDDRRCHLSYIITPPTNHHTPHHPPHHHQLAHQVGTLITFPPATRSAAASAQLGALCGRPL